MIANNPIQFLIAGILLGLTAGISPGPILTLVITQSIRYNSLEGIKVAVSPLITDLPVILVTLVVFNRLTQFNSVLGGISVTGSIYVAYLGYECMKTKGLNTEPGNSRARSLGKGIIANFLNPNPYLFWITIGTPYIFKALEISLLTAILFLSSFYVSLIGSKVVVAIITARTKTFFGNRLYIVIMKVLGTVLFLFSVLLLYEGIKYLISF